MFIVKLYYRIETFHVQTSYKTGGLLTEEIQSWLFVQCYVPIDRGIQFALRKMIACKNWSQWRIGAKLKSHLKFPHIHFVRIRKNVNIYFFVSTLNKEINIYACIYAYKWMCTLYSSLYNRKWLLHFSPKITIFSPDIIRIFILL